MRVVELFAGVGGFRIGFERVSKDFFQTVWSNQWEPSRKSQDAYNCYVSNFGDKHFCVNEDIAKVKNLIPKHDILCGGFPCQDYSVAHGNSAKGIEGKKGVLWWEIRDIVEATKPSIVFLENVDRLLKSPAKQRGRDFAIILRCLDDLGYFVEWRVVNASDYGHYQSRKRTFILAYNKEKEFYKKFSTYDSYSIIVERGIFARAFSASTESIILNEFDISKKVYEELSDLSDNFNTGYFENCGVMNDGIVSTIKCKSKYKGEMHTLREILDKDYDNKLNVSDEKLEQWKYLKGSKKQLRYKPNGEPYYYSEGAIPFPDIIDKPARTMLTSESSINRSSHIIQDPISQKYRILSPEECERINEFPTGWTNTGMSQKFRYFCMGNALVVGLIESIAREIKTLFQDE